MPATQLLFTTVTAATAAVLVAVACANTPVAAEAPSTTGAIDLTAPRQARPAWPPGLVPCAKDAPDGGAGCAAGPPKTAAAVGPSATPPDDTTVWSVPVGPDDPVRGPADALVTMVVFSDFQCPFCKRVTPTFNRILAEHPGDVRLVWKDLPLPAHEHAEAAAEFARAARAQKGDAAFWAAHDKLYDAQDALGEPTYRRIAETLGLPWAATWASVRAARFGAVIQADSQLSDRVDVPATPTTFINGRKLVGAQPYERTAPMVEAELDKARKRVAAGTARTDLYARIVAAGVQVQAATDTPAPK